MGAVEDRERGTAKGLGVGLTWAAETEWRSAIAPMAGSLSAALALEPRGENATGLTPRAMQPSTSACCWLYLAESKRTTPRSGQGRAAAEQRRAKRGEGCGG